MLLKYIVAGARTLCGLIMINDLSTKPHYLLLINNLIVEMVKSIHTYSSLRILLWNTECILYLEQLETARAFAQFFFRLRIPSTLLRFRFVDTLKLHFMKKARQRLHSFLQPLCTKSNWTKETWCEHLRLLLFKGAGGIDESQPHKFMARRRFEKLQLRGISP